MKRWLLAIVLAPVLGGCMGGSAAPTSPRPPSEHGPRATCVAAWNGPANAAVRTAAAPPRGPYPWYAHTPIRPQGGFQAFVGFILTIGGPAGTHPAPCAVYFWFPGGYRGCPALLSYREVDLRHGVFGSPSINARRTMRFHPGGRAYVEGRDGRLRPAPVARTGAAKCLADWNGPANASVRAGAAPPLQSHRHFQAFVGLSAVIGAVGTNPPPAATSISASLTGSPVSRCS